MFKDLPVKTVKPFKIGNSYYFRIPAPYMKHGLLKKNRLYDVKINDKDLLERQKISQRTDAWVILIDIYYVREGIIKPDKYYDLSFNLSKKD